MNRSWKSALAGFIKNNPIILIFTLLFVVDGVVFPSFFTSESISNLFRATSSSGIIAIGMTFVIICSDIDLSVGAVLALSGVIFAKLINVSFPLACAASLLAGVFCGLITGLLTVKAKLPPFISSLSTQYAIRGIVYIVTNQKAIKVREAPEIFNFLGNGNIFGAIPVPAAIFVLLGIAAAFILARTTFGRSVYATGSSTEAATMMGVRTPRVRIAAFVISGAMSALAGMITTSRLSAAQAVAGQDIEMTVIASIVLGGVLLRGGVGKMYNVMFGALFIRLLIITFNNIPTISTYWQTVITGLCLLAVVVSQNCMMSRKRLKKTVGGAAE